MAPPMLLLLLLSVPLFLVAPSCGENPLLIGSTEGLRNYTRVSEFRVVNRRVLGTCPDPNPYLDISVSPDSRLPDEGEVTVTVSGVLLPAKSDWVAMITPANAEQDLQLQECLSNNMLCSACFAMGLWTSWTWRCNIVFKDGFITTRNPAEYIIQY